MLKKSSNTQSTDSVAEASAADSTAQDGSNQRSSHPQVVSLKHVAFTELILWQQNSENFSIDEEAVPLEQEPKAKKEPSGQKQDVALHSYMRIEQE